MTAYIMKAFLLPVQKRLHWLLILNHLHSSFFLLKLYIQVYYSVSLQEHLTASYWDSSKAVVEYLEIWISALLIGKQNVTLPPNGCVQGLNWDLHYPGVGVDA